jgi:plasmid rolling circle replication initiator protein Rep
MIETIISSEVANDTTPVRLIDLSPTDKPWDIHAVERDAVGFLYPEEHPYRDKMADCSQWLEFALKQKDIAGVLGLSLQNARFCRVRHCPVCQWRRSLRWRARFFQILPQIREAYPSARFIFLTLTVRNCELAELRSTIEAMNKAWSSIARSNRKTKFPAIGWVKSLEVTRGKDDSAHPHFHCLLMVKDSYFRKENYLTQDDWTVLWQKALGIDYKPIVNVKVVKPKKNSDSDGIASAVCETLKYSVKPADLVSNRDSAKPADLASNREWLMGLTEQLHKLKAVSTGGVFKDFLSDLEREDKEENKDLIHVDGSEEEPEQELGRLYFTWSQKSKHYQT